MDKTNVSIVIPVLNEQDNLICLFDSIGRLKMNSNLTLSDIIVVDNGSTDASLTIANKYCTNVYVIPCATIADLRNFGAAHCLGEIIVFMDADCILAEDVINNVVTLLDDDMVAAVGPDGLIPVGISTWVQEMWYLHTRVLGGVEQSIEVDNLSSGFIAIKAKQFSEVSGFNGALSIGEDTDISRKLKSHGYKLVKSSLLCIYNSGHPRTLVRLLRREYWHGDSFRHLLIHRKLELLTVYFVVNAIAIMSSIILTIWYYSLALLFVYLLVSSIMPFYKAIKKVHGINCKTFKLYFIYFLYINARTVALFK